MMDETRSNTPAGTGPAAPAQAESAAPKPERGFAQGEYVILRPVLAADLRELARLLAENPFDHEPQPWTHQRLKQSFEDKDKPGLWDERTRYFAIVRQQGGVVGFIFEEDDGGHGGMWWNRFHICLAPADRDALGRDALATYFAYKQRWHDPLRISFSIAGCETQKAQWLSAAGYELEIEHPHAVWHEGRPATEMVFCWFNPRLLEQHADDGPVAGEAGGAVLDLARTTQAETQVLPPTKE